MIDHAASLADVRDNIVDLRMVTKPFWVSAA